MAKKKIGILGSGLVAQVLGSGFSQHGYEVMMGTRDASKLNDWKSKSGNAIAVGTPAEAAGFGGIVVLAVKGTGAEAVIRSVAPHLAGKTVIDATNPIADAAPENGVIKFTTDLNESLMEKLQKLAPSANFVKCFSCVGNHLMVNPQLPGGKPSMFIAGNSDSARREVGEILDIFGWETADMGSGSRPRH